MARNREERGIPLLAEEKLALAIETRREYNRFFWSDEKKGGEEKRWQELEKNNRTLNKKPDVFR